MGWIPRFEQELQSAQNARSAGNEGQARVCARRAAGIVAGEYLDRLGIRTNSSSAYDMLVQLQAIKLDDLAISRVVSELLMQVDIDHKLPEDVDLITDAVWLASHLLSYDNHP